jgi:hypothetical protein
MIAMCLKTRSSERANCSQLLDSPQLKKYVSVSLQEIESAEDKAALMKTIRMPRHMGDISDRLPGQQYNSQPKLKRNNS